MQIRALRSDEWEPLREVRLAALADPDAEIAFGEPLEAGRARTDDSWRDLATRGAAGETDRIVVADEDGTLMGMAAAFLEDDGAGAHVWGMYVDPEFRHRGIARGFLDALAEWAGEVGAKRLRLHATERNEAAARLYSSEGFTPTGEREKHRPDVDYWAIEMVRRVGD
jgi:GNAT superfamily N-acetyltransferase